MKMPRDDDDDAERASYVDAWESLLGFELGVGLGVVACSRQRGVSQVLLPRSAQLLLCSAAAADSAGLNARRMHCCVQAS